MQQTISLTQCVEVTFINKCAIISNKEGDVVQLSETALKRLAQELKVRCYV